ncbi:MAG: VOC family protein [Chitinophagales bacterium]
MNAMKTTAIVALLLMVFAIGCATAKKSTLTGSVVVPVTPVDSLPRVTGIGGIFFKTKSAKQSREWYHQHLGLNTDNYGSPFEFRNANRPEEINYLEWSPFSEKTTYFNPSKKDFMINYRVQYIEKLVENLKRDGVVVLDTIETYDYGKFVHIMDADSIKIELWEPIDSILTKKGGKTTK